MGIEEFGIAREAADGELIALGRFVELGNVLDEAGKRLGVESSLFGALFAALFVWNPLLGSVGISFVRD